MIKETKKYPFGSFASLNTVAKYKTPKTIAMSLMTNSSTDDNDVENKNRGLLK